MAIDIETCRPQLAAVTGGLSGPAIKPVAIRAIHQVHTALPDLPIIGMGGARTVEDVVEFMLAGANAVAIGTATFANPLATPGDGRSAAPLVRRARHQGGTQADRRAARRVAPGRGRPTNPVG